MPQGTLANLGKSAFVRTPPMLATRIRRHLLAFPQAPITILDPTAGEGDLLFPCRDVPAARLYGVEISAERVDAARRKLPGAEIALSAFEGVNIAPGSMSLVLANPPYFFQDGKRAEYRILADAGELLMPGGILVAIIPARSAWDGTMINHFIKWYDAIRIWKFPDRQASEDEGGFEDFTQICVAGVRRAEPQVATSAEKKRLQGYRWHKPEKPGQSGWEQGTPPPELPSAALPDPYQVPPATAYPTIVVRNADEATLLYALSKAGAHCSPAWQAATAWSEDGLLEPPAMPLTGEAHVAAEVLTGVLDGEIVWGPGTGADAQPHLLTSFVGQEWVSMSVDAEEKAKLRERGVVHVSMRQLQDKPILGVLNLHTGRSRYYQGEEVFTFLQPWLHTLAAQVIAKRTPLYQLDPQDWEIRVVSQFATDKRLPNAAFAGLAPAQQHRVYAMCRSIDARGRTAIQGEPGTGKTRLATATAALMAYRWRQRTSEFGQSAQPKWVSGLRRAWLKNPATLALLGIEPVYAPGTGQVVAYRDLHTGQQKAPEDVGPKALPVLVTTPKKVTREYGKEIAAAWPQAEVISIERHTDIPRWMQRCATSKAPAVIAIFSHSTTRAFGREWRPVVSEKMHTSIVPVLDPDEDLRELLEPVRDQHDRLVGFRFIGSDDLLTREVTVPYFYCPDCQGRIDAVPGRINTPAGQEKGEATGVLKAAQEKEDERLSEPVTSLTWFKTKQRWCTCRSDARNLPGPHNAEGRQRFRTPLWSDARTEATQRKHPQLPFAAWSKAMTRLREIAAREEAGASLSTYVEVAQRHEDVLQRLVESAMVEKEALVSLIEVVQEYEPAFVSQVEALERSEGALARVLVDAVWQDVHDEALTDLLTTLAAHSEAALQRLLMNVAKRDMRTLSTLVDMTACSGAVQLASLIEAVKLAEAAVVSTLFALAKREKTVLLQLVEVAKQDLVWAPLFFQSAFEDAHLPGGGRDQATARNGANAKKRSEGSPYRGVRLVLAAGGPITVAEPDLSAAQGYEPVLDDLGEVVAYQHAPLVSVLLPIFGIRSRRVVGYVSSETGQVVSRTHSYEFRLPPADSFSPYDYLYQCYRGCVALSIVDESHNGRGRDTDIARAHHLAMLSAQARELTSGTHYGGDVLGFYHYWYRYNPQFWRRFGFGWNDAEQALSRYGVIQEWTKEYESEARRGSGQTNIQVSTIPAPGLSAKLIPHLLEDLVYLTVLDVGAYMPPRIEIPEIVPMRDLEVERAVQEAERACAQIQRDLTELQKARRQLLQGGDTTERRADLDEIERREQEALRGLAEAQRHEAAVMAWAMPRNLSHHYLEVVKRLEDLSRQRNNAARMAKGTVPRWFAALPCESPFEVWQTERSDWGDKLDRRLLVHTPVLAREHLYPMERRLIEIVEREVAEGRRVMLYFEQNDLRSMARRLEEVLKAFCPWTLPNGVEAEDRQQAILDAVEAGSRVVIVPYRRVNEGLNLQRGIDTIIWVEMAMNLFMLDQASRRAWRLGKEEEVRIYFLVYAGTAGHSKLRKLGGQSGAAAAFAGEPARGALIEHAGADKTTLARLSASLEVEDEEGTFDVEQFLNLDDGDVLKAAFAKRGEELRAALKRGRQWFGVTDTLAERLAAMLAAQRPSVWEDVPAKRTKAAQRTAPPLPDAPVVDSTLVKPSTTALGGVSGISKLIPTIATGDDGSGLLGDEPVRTSDAHRRDGALAPAAIGTKAVVVFGFKDHIELVRKRRQRPRSTARPRNRTEVHCIPAVGENGIGEHTPLVSAGIVLLSLWPDDVSLLDEDAKMAPASLPQTLPFQGGLWGQ
jgi:predicted RNA methylase